jgi:hypothetical protein
LGHEEFRTKAVGIHGRIFATDGGAWSATAVVDGADGGSGMSCTTPKFCVVVTGGGDALMEGN